MIPDTAVPERYYTGPRRARYALNWALLVPLTAVLAGLGILVSFVDREGRKTHELSRLWARWILRLAGIHLRVTGLERLDPEADYVFVANHHSALDIPVLLAAFPLRVRMLAKATLFRIPFLGWYIRRVGYVPVDRDDPRVARRVLQAGLLGAGRGGSLLVFPQGTRTPEGHIGAFKRGAVYLARATGLPVVPVAVINAGNLLPRLRLSADPGIVEVRVGAPVASVGHTPTRVLARSLRQEVAALARRDALA